MTGGWPRVPNPDGRDQERNEPAWSPLQAAVEEGGPSPGKAARPAARPAAHLRHTCATVLLMAGKHPKYVQELLGHASMSITLDTYSHVQEGMGGGLTDVMDGAV